MQDKVEIHKWATIKRVKHHILKQSHHINSRLIMLHMRTITQGKSTWLPTTTIHFFITCTQFFLSGYFRRIEIDFVVDFTGCFVEACWCMMFGVCLMVQVFCASKKQWWEDSVLLLLKFSDNTLSCRSNISISLSLSIDTSRSPYLKTFSLLSNISCVSSNNNTSFK